MVVDLWHCVSQWPPGRFKGGPPPSPHHPPTPLFQSLFERWGSGVLGLWGCDCTRYPVQSGAEGGCGVVHPMTSAKGPPQPRRIACAPDPHRPFRRALTRRGHRARQRRTSHK